MEQVLIDAVRDLAIKAMLVDAPGAKRALLKSNMLLARKIALFSLGEAIRQSGNNEQHQRSLLAVAGELLYDEHSSDDSCRIDFAELARAVAHVSAEALDPLTHFIDQNSPADDDRLREWMHNDGAEDARSMSAFKNTMTAGSTDGSRLSAPKFYQRNCRPSWPNWIQGTASSMHR